MTDVYDQSEDNANKSFEIKKFFFKAISYWYLFVLSILISFFAARWRSEEHTSELQSH